MHIQEIEHFRGMWTRRALLQRAMGVSLAAFVGPALLAGCGGADRDSGGEDTASSETDGADGAACAGDLSLAQAGARKALNYVPVSKEAGKFCHNCRFYKPPAGDEACGGCDIVAGAIEPAGYCNSWVAVADA